MRAKASGGGGRIVNVGSRAAVVPAAGSIAYTVAKAAVGALTASLAKELEGEKILVNAVVPSIIDTAANRAAMTEADHDRWPKPAEIAATIAWLASPECARDVGRAGAGLRTGLTRRLPAPSSAPARRCRGRRFRFHPRR